MKVDDVKRLNLGTFVRPVVETGTGTARVEAVYGYAVPHDGGLIILDTGLGEAAAETEAWYRPRRLSLANALHRHGFSIGEAATVVNCHLHFDHISGNPQFAGLPIVSPVWMSRLLAFDPRRVVFAHDAAIWQL